MDEEYKHIVYILTEKATGDKYEVLNYYNTKQTLNNLSKWDSNKVSRFARTIKQYLGSG